MSCPIFRSMGESMASAILAQDVSSGNATFGTKPAVEGLFCVHTHARTARMYRIIFRGDSRSKIDETVSVDCNVEQNRFAHL